jgi:hypothetical protein
MKEKFFVLTLAAAAVFLVAVSVTDLWGMMTFSMKYRPMGSYTQSCRNISVSLEGSGIPLRVITAECRRDDGTWHKTSIKLPYMQANPRECTLSNDNGELKVNCD